MQSPIIIGSAQPNHIPFPAIQEKGRFRTLMNRELRNLVKKEMALQADTVHADVLSDARIACYKVIPIIDLP